MLVICLLIHYILIKIQSAYYNTCLNIVLRYSVDITEDCLLHNVFCDGVSLMCIKELRYSFIVTSFSLNGYLVVYTVQVIGRIFYIVDKNWNGRITASELRRSNFLQVLSSLEEEADINRVTDYFSYEHFYVIYCKFWELDTDHDLVISAQDLARHADHALTTRIINRVMSGVVTRFVRGSYSCVLLCCVIDYLLQYLLFLCVIVGATYK